MKFELKLLLYVLNKIQVQAVERILWLKSSTLNCPTSNFRNSRFSVLGHNSLFKLLQKMLELVKMNQKTLLK